MIKRKNRVYPPEFKQEAIALVKQQGYSITEAARSLGIDPKRIHDWIKKQEAMPFKASLATDSDEHAELLRLRKENKRLLMERESLKKAATFFAQESQ